ncbi:MAG: WXG100 family type VII secretion target [Corynebacterium sp.]|nr:WXG100 family type VII secretion target [Corynebacterium sp.]
MSTRIKYNFGEISAASQSINSQAAKITERLTELKRRLQPMVAEWQGESAAAYNVAQEQWDKSMANLNMILQTISKNLHQSNANMDAVNKRAAQSWQMS